MLFNYSILFIICAFRIITVASASNAKHGKSIEKILSRKRRYLIFPIGSSLQLAYDQDITIPDYEYYLMTGVTASLAWPLPSQPSYPDLEYENGDIPISVFDRKDDIVNTTAATAHASAADGGSDSVATNELDEALWQFFNYLEQNRRPDSFYFGDAIHVPYSPDYAAHGHYDLFTKYLIDSYFKPMLAAVAQRNGSASATSAAATTSSPTRRPSDDRSTEFVPVINKLHTIYPAIGKRSIRSPTFTYADQFYMDHHRSTRHGLYGTLEKYLSANGLNGTACVLKTLCEVGQKAQENEPGSFLAEIVRIIFSLPAAQLERPMHKRHIDYDDAHQNAIDCSEAYAACPTSVWNSWFMMETIADFDRLMLSMYK